MYASSSAGAFTSHHMHDVDKGSIERIERKAHFELLGL
jgi:hypothetical protein